MEAMVEIYIRTIPPILLDKTLSESKIKEDHQINVMMIKRNGKVIQVGKDTLVLPEDSIVVFGPYQKIKEIFLNNEVEYNEKLIEKVIE
jgi:Trk K+ transport system NAD-binding subunit